MTAPTIEDVQTNEAARRLFQRQMAAADKAADALAAYEQAQKELAALATSGVDGMAATRFDGQATAAQSHVADLIGGSDMSAAAGAIDGIRGAAQEGLSALDKYRDAEDLVASNNVDGRTLEPSAA